MFAARGGSSATVAAKAIFGCAARSSANAAAPAVPAPAPSRNGSTTAVTRTRASATSCVKWNQPIDFFGSPQPTTQTSRTSSRMTLAGDGIGGARRVFALQKGSSHNVLPQRARVRLRLPSAAAAVRLAAAPA